MKVVKKQANSRMCIICGLDNKAGVQAPFYEMEDKSVVTIFKYKEIHQSYPERVHGGLITAMLDELGLRALWPIEPDCWGVTFNLQTKYRKPVPYDKKLIGVGKIIKNTPRFIVSEAKIYDDNKNLLAEANIKYLKLDINKIAKDVDVHEEMAYLIQDNVTEIDV